MKKISGKVLLLFIIGVVTLSSVGLYVFFTNSPSGGNESIDMSFDSWTYTNIIPGTRYIEDKGDYIEICNSNNAWSTLCSAKLAFRSSTEVTWKFQLKRLDTSCAKFYIRSGETYLVQICGYQYSSKLMLCAPGFPWIPLMASNDKAWHDIEVSCKVDGTEAEITVKIDSVIIVNAQKFLSTITTLDNVYYTSAQYYTTYTKTITHLILDSLVVSW